MSQPHFKFDKKHFIKAVITTLFAIIVLGILIVFPQQTVISSRVGGAMRQPAQTKIYQLRGVYNLIQHHKYRVDYFDSDQHKLTTKYYQDKNQIQAKDWGNAVESNWTFGD